MKQSGGEFPAYREFTTHQNLLNRVVMFKASYSAFFRLVYLFLMEAVWIQTNT